MPAAMQAGKKHIVLTRDARGALEAARTSRAAGTETLLRLPRC